MSQQHLVLVNPAFFDGDEFRNRFEAYLEWIKGGNLYVAPFEPPLGLAYLAAALKSSGHRVTLLDMQGSIMDGEALALAGPGVFTVRCPARLCSTTWSKMAWSIRGGFATARSILPMPTRACAT